MNFFMIYLLFIWITVKIKSIHSTDNSLDTTIEKHYKDLKPINTSVVCNKTSLEVVFNFEKPFYGVIYSNQIFSRTASQCRSYGNGSKVIHFITNSSECGVTYTDNEPNYSEYELVLYVQNDRNIQQSSDEKIEVKCWPRNVLLRGVMGSEGNRTHNSTTKLSAKSLYGVYGMDGATHIQVHQMRSHHLTLSHVTDSLECRLDVMRGRIPFLKPIEGFVDLGQDVTLLIRIKEIDGIDSMVSRCYAHEGSHAVIQELTNTDGCSIDMNILPNFQLMPNPPSDFKVYFTTFPAFKFPDKTNLNIQCTLIICNKTCPQIQCDNTRGIGFSPSLHRIKRESSHRKQRNAKRAIIMERELTANNNNEHNDWDSLLSLISLTNALPVRHDRHSIHNESHKTIKTIKPKHQIYMKQLDEQCLTPLLLIALSALTVIGLLCALTITCYHCYRNTISNSNPHKLLQSHNYAYDMNSKHNQCLQPIPLAPLPHLSI